MNQEIINKIKQTSIERYGQCPQIAAAPGRINLIGEHLDYNQGIVFPAAIDKSIYTGICHSTNQKSQMLALDLNESFEVDLQNLQKIASSHWANYGIGILAGLIKRGKKISNFNLVFAGDIPLGAGLSSSAALENSIVFNLNEFFDLELSRDEMIQISLEAEHEYAGVECGIMDQFSSMMGQKDQALLLNCKDLSHQLIPIKLSNHQLILINTNIKHILSDSPYNERRNQCYEGLRIIQLRHPEISSLAKVTLEQLKSSRSAMSKLVYNRSLFVVEEVQRVEAAKNAVLNQEWVKFGKLLNASHKGLKDLYEVSCPELDFLADLTRDNEDVLGSRMMGGGFGGCTLNLVKKTSVSKFIANTTRRYHAEFGHFSDSYCVQISNGTRIID